MGGGGGGWRRVFCIRDPKSTIDNEQPQPTTHRTASFKLSLFRNSFKFRNNCGICSNGVKTRQGTAIYTAECGHAFHFPCISVHVSSNNSSLTCPVCNATWKDVSVLAQPNDVVAAVESTTGPQTENSDSVKPYDDDEPLPCPFSGIPIALIPEADDENDEGENQNYDFQGIWVDPKPELNDADSRSVRVNLMPECAFISASESQETYALVLRLKAPPPPPFRNAASPPVDLVAVVDVGSGMTSAKLHMLKRGLRLLISSLGSADRLTVVASSAQSKRLMPLRRMTAKGQRVARRVVHCLATGNGTTASAADEALGKAAKILEERRERNPVSCVVLLSNGYDAKNDKIQKSNIKNHQKRFSFSQVSSSRFIFIEIPVHSSRFGRKTGFISDPAEDNFAKRIEGIFSVAVQDLRFQLGVSAPDEIVAVYSCNGRPRSLGLGAFRVGDLYAEEEREHFVELRVSTSALETNHVINMRCIYKDPVNREIVCGMEHAVQVELRLESRAERLKNVFIMNRAIAQSDRLVEQNEFHSAYCLVGSARELLARCGSAEEYVHGLDAEMVEIRRRMEEQEQQGRVGVVDEGGGDVLMATPAWRAAERLAKMAMMKRSLNRVIDLHGFEDARF